MHDTRDMEHADGVEVLERYTEGGQEIVVIGKKGQMMPSPMDMVRVLQSGLSDKHRSALEAMWHITKGFGSGPTTQPVTPRRKGPRRNDPCPCNSGSKYKKCCGVKG